MMQHEGPYEVGIYSEWGEGVGSEDQRFLEICELMTVVGGF